MVVGELRQYVPEGRDNIYQWRDRRDVSQQLGRVVIILNIDIYFKLILDQSRQSYHLGCMIVPVELHVHVASQRDQFGVVQLAFIVLSAGGRAGRLAVGQGRNETNGGTAEGPRCRRDQSNRSRPGYATTPSTIFPWTSVSRKFRPWYG